MSGAAGAGAVALDARSRAMWLLHQFDGGVGVANVGVSVACDGFVDAALLTAAVQEVLRRQPALRCSFHDVDGVPVRTLHGDERLPVVEISYAVDDDDLDAAITRLFSRPFDLENELLLRVGLWFRPEGGSVIALCSHHLVFDATSVELLIEELTLAYMTVDAGLGAHQLPPPAPEPRNDAEPDPRSVEFWRDHLEGLETESMRLSGTRADPTRSTMRGDTIGLVVEGAALDAMLTLRTATRSSENLLMLTIFTAALQLHGAHESVSVGMPVNLRSGPTLQAIGYHVNTLPVRPSISLDQSVTQAVAQVRDVVVACLEHKDVPVEGLSLVRGSGDVNDWRTQLFRHMVSFVPFRERDLWFAGAPARRMSRGRSAPDASRLDLEVNIERGATSMDLHAAFNTDVLDRAYAEAFLRRMLTLLVSAAKAPDTPMRELDWWTAEDEAIARADADDAAAEPTVVERWLEHLADSPGAVALVDPSGAKVSRGELAAQARRIAGALDAAGVQRGDRVGVVCPRGRDLAAAVLAAWTLHAAFVPLDPGGAPRRLAELAEDVDIAAVVVSDGQDVSQWWSGPAPVDAAEHRTANVAPPTLDALPDGPPGAGQPAYVISTSGSTGRPKSVQITHADLAAETSGMLGVLGEGAAARVAWTSAFTFDPSIFELCAALATGGELVAFPEGFTLGVTAGQELSRSGVTLVQATPTVWDLLLGSVEAGAFGGVTLLTGGEHLSGSLAARLLDTGGHVVNCYGPTETTIWATTDAVRDPQDVAVGRPLPGRSVAVVDEHGRRLPPGLVGEIWLAGVGLADGFVGRVEPGGTAFTVDPVLGPVYRTGDLGHLGWDGRLRLQGRRDRQVKVRGVRLELDAVEAVLAEHPGVVAAAAVVQDGQVWAYVQAVGEVADLRAHCAASLHVAAVPSRVVVLARLPRTTSGKVDRRRLAPPPAAPADEQVLDESDDQVVAALVELWGALLGDDVAVGPATDFFTAGGDSLLAARAAAKVNAETGVKLTIRDVYEARTPSDLAVRIAEAATTP